MGGTRDAAKHPSVQNGPPQRKILPQMSAVPMERPWAGAIHGEQVVAESQGWVGQPLTHISSWPSSTHSPPGAPCHTYPHHPNPTSQDKSQNPPSKGHAYLPCPTHQQAIRTLSPKSTQNPLSLLSSASTCFYPSCFYPSIITHLDQCSHLYLCFQIPGPLYCK